ncbi:peptidoglycan DD-metalloendopeptidase family protein [Myxococcota bacterium]|nr:peptidoglycan DD-metalloendopeptidase family protein [Myxococcota bacterium]
MAALKGNARGVSIYRPGRRATVFRRVSVWGLVVFALVSGARADRSQDLHRLREAVREGRDRVAAYESRGRGLLEAIEALDRSAAGLVEEVEASRRRAEKARESLAGIEVRAEEIARNLAQTQQAMSRRAVGLYKAGEAGSVRLLFSSGGIREFLSRVNALRLLLQHDAELLETHRRQSHALQAVRDEAGEAEVQWNRLASELVVRSAELAEERRAKHELAAAVHADRVRERIALIEYETAAHALAETIGGLDPRPLESLGGGVGGFGSRRGRLESPVSAKIVRSFGREVDPRFDIENFHRGVEYGAEMNTPVRVVAKGRVRFSGWLGGYGQLVIVDHGDEYFTIYGHLASVAVDPGESVPEGRVVGRVGDTGSLEGPRLYFEIRKADEALDPLRWLSGIPAG